MALGETVMKRDWVRVGLIEKRWESLAQGEENVERKDMLQWDEEKQ